MRRAMQIIVPFVLIMAFIGLGYELFFNPLGFLKQLLFIAGFVAVVYLLYRWYLSRRYGTSLFPSRQGPTKAQIRKAKRTSTVSQPIFKRQPNVKGPNRRKAQTKRSHQRSPLKRRDDHNLTVIEGKKNKKKNRAFF
ncbi:SA1362 family protein [Halalkalibacter urbisdiaboli]|uniref:SA1362 family protein n=1 Tax=Halalkalibacter urbisdiaboli TaxID=1960589 RepID=UPI000B437216|nr:SA1362 family protein [Halalkalibacter urbisdiaboli]